jgi:hypothetical protein
VAAWEFRDWGDTRTIGTLYQLLGFGLQAMTMA